MAAPPTIPDRAGLAAEREAALAAGDDARLLALRELELAGRALDPVIAGVRRDRLVAHDALATTWEGWELDGGRRVLLRVIRPRWRRDPVMRRRFLARLRPPAVRHPHLALPAVVGEAGGWLHLRVALRGLPLGELAALGEPPGTEELARLLGAGLAALDALHRAGFVLGGDPGRLLCADPERPALAWLDPFDPGGGPADDLRALARAVAALDPEGEDPLGLLAASWAEDPPPSARDAGAVLRGALAGLLAAERHRLVRQRRRRGRQDRAARLARAVRRLERALPPPPGRFCLRAGRDAVLVVVHSDGQVVRGGATADPRTRHLPRAWSAEAGLEPAPTRFLLRAWAGRAEGDEARRRRVQAELGARDAEAEALMRWLSGMARLRRARKLVEFRARRGA